jgi:prepilin-type processing-associated H-X9-DG protein
MWDLIAILVVAGFVLGWFAFEHSGERGHVARCARNLKGLGEATQVYANDHSDGLPAAVINMGAGGITWDMELAPYLRPGAAKAKSLYDRERLIEQKRPWLVCPSDFLPRANPRSYAMSARYMMYGWPPRPDDKTGVGLFWDKNSVTVILGKDMAESALKNHDLLPRFKRSMLPDPANTLWLTELISPDNGLRRSACSEVAGVNQQEEYFEGDSSHFHFGKFNYLMADGHVELLTGAQSDGSAGKRHNIWTINPGD